MSDETARLLTLHSARSASVLHRPRPLVVADKAARPASLPQGLALAELHVHVGSAVDPAVMWSIAHAQGIRLPTKNYWEFVQLITVDRRRVKGFDDYLALFHWTELIQSSPEAMERSVYEIIGGAYRRHNIQRLELRFNPMKRNRGGERDLDHIIAAAIRGMERSLLEYPVHAGLILCLDKAFDYELNEIIVHKAIAHAERGVVGIDIAGPESPSFSFARYRPLFSSAREAGLGLTVHAGESGTLDAMREALRSLRPDRIGHGIKAAHDPELLAELREAGVLLEVCPTSNLHTRVVGGVDELLWVLSTLASHGVPFSINTDGPEMLGRGLRDELNWLLRRRLLGYEQVLRCNQWAYAHSFVR
ncbi:MAG: adenosine deaminase [Chloroflexi bacterium]|nr:adenosine deaminase [Chloroflexota bacterium]